MTTKAANAIAHPARRAVQRHHGSIERLARAGYVSRGFLYLIIGVLAALAAFGRGGDTTNHRGALQTISEQPFGRVLLALTALGLLGHALFRFAQAVLDPEQRARGDWGWAKRALWFGIGLVHMGLSIHAATLLFGGDASGDSSSGARTSTARLLAWTPLGAWLVAAAGIALIGAGLHQLWCAWRAKLDEQLDLSRASGAARGWMVRLSRFGIGARGVVACVAGSFLAYAAATADPSEAKDFGESLAALRAAPMGSLLLGLVALGLVAYALYQFIAARYRHIRMA
jgi:hypothetical protein